MKLQQLGDRQAWLCGRLRVPVELHCAQHIREPSDIRLCERRHDNGMLRSEELPADADDVSTQGALAPYEREVTGMRKSICEASETVASVAGIG